MGQAPSVSVQVDHLAALRRDPTSRLHYLPKDLLVCYLRPYMSQIFEVAAEGEYLQPGLILKDKQLVHNNEPVACAAGYDMRNAFMVDDEVYVVHRRRQLVKITGAVTTVLHTKYNIEWVQVVHGLVYVCVYDYKYSPTAAAIAHGVYMKQSIKVYDNTWTCVHVLYNKTEIDTMFTLAATGDNTVTMVRGNTCYVINTSTFKRVTQFKVPLNITRGFDNWQAAMRASYGTAWVVASGVYKKEAGTYLINVVDKTIVRIYDQVVAKCHMESPCLIHMYGTAWVTYRGY